MRCYTQLIFKRVHPSQDAKPHVLYNCVVRYETGHGDCVVNHFFGLFIFTTDIFLNNYIQLQTKCLKKYLITRKIQRVNMRR